VKIKVTIVSAAGILEDYAVSDRVKVGRIKKRVMKRLLIPPELADRYWLRHEDTMLDDGKTLSKQGIKSGSLLYLETAPPRVG